MWVLKVCPYSSVVLQIKSSMNLKRVGEFKPKTKKQTLQTLQKMAESGIWISQLMSTCHELLWLLCTEAAMSDNQESIPLSDQRQ